MQTSKCLASREPCNARARCHDDRRMHRSCLTTNIPAWSVPLSRVKCCFRCCLLTWIRRLGLRHNMYHWQSRGVDHYMSQGAGGSRRIGAPLPSVWMDEDEVLNPRFAVSRFAHFLALESRDLDDLNKSTARSVLTSGRFCAPYLSHPNGTLVVLNRWSHPPELFSRISSWALPPGPVALLYGDDSDWSKSELLSIRDAFNVARPLVAHFAMNMGEDALTLAHARQVPIGLNRNAMAIPAIIPALEDRIVSSAHRSSRLVCCCQRPWHQRIRAFEQLRLAGHAHCNLTERRPFEELFREYATHRFAVSVYGHGRTDFREWEILLAGAVPVVQHFPHHDELLRGLPVVRVTDWSLVTPAFLDAEWQRIQLETSTGAVSWTKVYFPYWFAQFTAHMAAAAGVVAGVRGQSNEDDGGEKKTERE